MSRGPGRLQRAIIAAFDAHPSAVFSAKEIIKLGFPSVVDPLPKHRVAALRAARGLADNLSTFEIFLGAPSAGGLLLVNATNRRSLGIGRVFQKFAGLKPVAECVAILEDPSSEAYPEAQPDGFFDLLARRNAAWADDRDEDAEAISIRIRERVAQAERERSTSSSTAQEACP